MSPRDKLLWDMKVTAGSRFIAAARLSSKDRIANISIAIYSAIVVSTSLVTLVFDVGATVAKVVGVGTLVASIVILVLSMKLFADRHAVEAEQMHRCALEINELRRTASFVQFPDEETSVNIANNYNAILQKYSINHSNSDFLKYKFSHKWDFEDIKDLDAKNLRLKRPGEFKSNAIEKMTALLGGAGLAAAIASLVSALIGL